MLKGGRKERIKIGIYSTYGIGVCGGYLFYIIKLYQDVFATEEDMLGPRGPFIPLLFASLLGCLLLASGITIYNIKTIKNPSPCRFWNGIGYMLVGLGPLYWFLEVEVVDYLNFSWDSPSVITYALILLMHPITIGIAGVISLLIAHRREERRYLKGGVALLLVSVIYIAIVYHLLIVPFISYS